MGHAGGIDGALHRVVERAEEALLIDERVALLGFLDRDQLGLQAQDPCLALSDLQEVEPGRAIRQHEAAGHVDAAGLAGDRLDLLVERSEEHTSELQSLMRISYAVFCLKKKNKKER